MNRPTREWLQERFGAVERLREKKDNPILRDFAEAIHGALSAYDAMDKDRALLDWTMERLIAARDWMGDLHSHDCPSPRLSTVAEEEYASAHQAACNCPYLRVCARLNRKPFDE